METVTRKGAEPTDAKITSALCHACWLSHSHWRACPMAQANGMMKHEEERQQRDGEAKGTGVMNLSCSKDSAHAEN